MRYMILMRTPYFLSMEMLALYTCQKSADFSVVLMQLMYPLLPFGVCFFDSHQELLHLMDVLSTRRMADSMGDCLWYTSRTETRRYQR